MSVEAMAWAFKQQFNGDATLKLVLLALCDHADDEHRCWPSQERLAAKSECSVDTVQRKLKNLEKLGLVVRRRRARKTAMYLISVNKKPMKPQYVRRHMTPQPAASSMKPQMELYETANAVDDTAQLCGINDTAKLCGPNHQSKPSIIEPSSSAPSARGGQPTNDMDGFEPTNEPPKARLFRKGKTILVSLGLSEERSGSVIGQWLKHKHDPVGILAAIEYARQQCAVSPVAYVTQILKGQTDGKTKSRPDFDDTIRELADQARDLERAAGIRRPDDHFRSN